IGNGRPLFFVPRETVEIELLVGAFLGAIKTLEKAAVEERYICEAVECCGRVAELFLIAVKGVHAVGGAVLLKSFILGEGAVRMAIGVFAHALVERREEKVLQNGLMVAGGIERK